MAYINVLFEFFFSSNHYQIIIEFWPLGNVGYTNSAATARQVVATERNEVTIRKTDLCIGLCVQYFSGFFREPIRGC